MTWFWILGGDRIVASSRIRHELIPAFLLDGGHIGYEVRPSERRRGIGSEVLRRTLEKARHVGLRRVLLTTDTTNVGSIGVILANGGVFENTSVPRTPAGPSIGTGSRSSARRITGVERGRGIACFN